jgi:hypothetical protein
MFIYIDRVIQKKRRDYSDPNSSGNMKKLNDDLQNIQDIMRKTIDDVLDRGNKLDGKTLLSNCDVIIIFDLYDLPQVFRCQIWIVIQGIIHYMSLFGIICLQINLPFY